MAGEMIILGHYKILLSFSVFSREAVLFSEGPLKFEQ